MNRAVVIVSAAGFQNFGDDVILSRWLPVYSGYHVFLVSGAHVEHDVFRRIPIWDIHSNTIGEIQGAITAYPRRLVHLLGGGYCNDRFDSAAKIFSLVEALQSIAPVIATGISFAPLGSASISQLKKLRFSYISLRDDFAHEHINSAAKPVLGDDLLPAFPRPRSGRSRDLYINIQNQFDIMDSLKEIGRKIDVHLASTDYENVYLCELCPGDLDVCDWIETPIKIIRRQEFWGLSPRSGDHFIGTRFHFRMLMERAGASGIVIVSDPEYYANKHETGSRSINFPKSARLTDISGFLNDAIAFPSPSRARRVRPLLKSTEFAAIRLLARRNWPRRLRRALPATSP